MLSKNSKRMTDEDDDVMLLEENPDSEHVQDKNPASRRVLKTGLLCTSHFACVFDQHFLIFLWF